MTFTGSPDRSSSLYFRTTGAEMTVLLVYLFRFELIWFARAGTETEVGWVSDRGKETAITVVVRPESYLTDISSLHRNSVSRPEAPILFSISRLGCERWEAAGWRYKWKGHWTSSDVHTSLSVGVVPTSYSLSLFLPLSSSRYSPAVLIFFSPFLRDVRGALLTSDAGRGVAGKFQPRGMLVLFDFASGRSSRRTERWEQWKNTGRKQGHDLSWPEN